MSTGKKARPAGRFPGELMVYGEIFLTIQINAFLYYLSRLPVLGKTVHGSWHSRYRLKKIWSIFGLVFGFIKSALANNIGTLIILYAVPHLFLTEEKLTEGVYLLLFVLVKCVGGALTECGLFKTTAEDYTFLNHFMVNPDSYYRYKAARNALFSGVMLFPAIYFLFRDWKLTGMLVLFKLFCMLGGNILYLSFYKKYGRLPDKRVRRILVFPVVLSAYMGAYLDLYRNIGISPVWQLTGSILCGILAVICWRYHMHYTDYKKIAVRFANQSAVTFQISVQSSLAGEEENGLLESGWEENRAFFGEHREEAPERYLELAFRKRFGRALGREWRDRILTVLFIGMVLGLGIRFGWLPVTSDTVLDYTPVLIALAVSMSFAGRLLQVYFRNMDLPVLYHHMASPEFIRRSMLRRYLHLLKGAMISSAAMVLNLLLILLVSGLRVPGDTVGKLALVCMAFLIFWETYECIVYYSIQPYGADMTAKSPVFKILGYLEGIFNLLILFVRRDLTAALPWVCGACACGAAAFFVSRRFAPGTFKLR